MSLFQLGDFVLHSGARSGWIINCDELTDADLEALALLAYTRLPAFSRVVGVPRGGLRFAEALRTHADESGRLLIADDVYTTGSSMNEQLRTLAVLEGCTHTAVAGVVIFARRVPPPWITPLFQVAT